MMEFLRTNSYRNEHDKERGGDLMVEEWTSLLS